MGNRRFKDLLEASMKSKDTEEWLDVHFTRPIGLFFALIWERLGVHPNTITIISIFLGLAAGWMFHYTDTVHNLMGVVLLMLANFCDSTDGQLARLTGQKTMIGRCLDGFAGDVWFFAIYLALVFRLWPQPLPGLETRWGVCALAACAVAGLLSHSPQSSLADYYRQIHLFFLKGREGSELDSSLHESQELARLPRRGAFWARAFHYNYRNYCRSQERRTPQFQALMDRLRVTYGSPALAPQPWKDAFLQGSRPLMWMTNFLTFNSRAILIYATCLLDCPWVYLFMEIVVYNLIATRTSAPTWPPALKRLLPRPPVRASARPTTTSWTTRLLPATPRPTSNRRAWREKTARGGPRPLPASHKRPDPYQTQEGVNRALKH